MDKQKFMQFISEAIDIGCAIEISHHGVDLSKVQSLELAEKFKAVAGGEVNEIGRDIYTWYAVDGEKHSADFFHEESIASETASAD